MAIDSWSKCRVHGTWADAEGNKLAGTARAFLTHRLVVSPDNVMVPAGNYAPGSVELVHVDDTKPSLDFMAPATDDPDVKVTPAGADWALVLRVDFDDNQRESETFYIDQLPSGGSVDLSELPLSDYRGGVIRVPVQGEPGLTPVVAMSGDQITVDGVVVGPHLTGPKGDTGPANALTIGTVTTLAPGDPVTASIRGTAPNQVLDLGIPGQIQDTGWRKLPTEGGWTEYMTGVKIRRIGSVVYVRGGVNGTNKTDIHFLTLPTGFRVNEYVPLGLAYPVVNSPLAATNSNNRLMFGGVGSVATNITFSGSFVTSDVWPTTLPGTPA